MTVEARSMDPRVLAKLEGCLTGVAVGDAMGMPSELWSRQKVKRRFGRITGFLPGPDDHFIVAGYAAGQFTDDTAQTLRLSEAIIASGGEVLPGEVAQAILRWAEETDAFATSALGPSSQKALLAIKAGTPVEEAGGSGDTNGAAMRIAPVGLIRKPSSIPLLVDAVQQACLATHNTNVAIAGAAMLAAAISTAVETDEWNVILERAAEAYHEGMTRGNDVFGASSLARLEIALGIVREDTEEEAVLSRLYDVIGSGVAITEAVPVAIALAVSADGDPVRASLLAANLGGDCDTVGAMAGGLCGAYSGITAFPDVMIRQIEEVNPVDLRGVARRLAPYRC